MEPLRFTVALSYPGEHRAFVSQVADNLASTFSTERVLYDKYHDEEFARLDLNTYLPALYRKNSELIVIFLCPEYAAKLWCRLEWRHISQLIASVDANRIMFLSFGNPGDLSDLGILSGDGYIDILPLAPETVSEKIIKRLRLNQNAPIPKQMNVESLASDEDSGARAFPTDKPTMRMERGIKVEIFDANSSTVTVLSWDLPPMSKRFGAVATQYCPTWKKIHSHSEQVYDAFRYAHIQMLLSHERKDWNGGEAVSPAVERAVTKYRQFMNEIETYPKDVSEAEHLVALQAARRGFSALFWHLSNSKPGTDGFKQAVVFVELLCTWCFETLSRADRVLEKYFDAEISGI